MIHLKKGASFEPQMSLFHVLVVTVVVLFLTSFCTGQSQMIGPHQPIVAMVGDDIILPCHLEPAMDAVSMTVEWARADLSPRFVHLRREGVELLMDQNPSYFGRTSVSINKLKHGDLSLTLSKVKVSDEGSYKCYIPTEGTEYIVKLVVGYVSSPVVIISRISTGLLFICESKGGYPEPEVVWLDGEGNLLSAGPTETVRGPDDLYTVSSRVTVVKRHSNIFTCRVQQKDINQTRDIDIHFPDDFFANQSRSFYITIGLAVSVCFICLFAAMFVLWKSGHNKTEIKWHQDDETDVGERETISKSGAELQFLDEGKMNEREVEVLNKKIGEMSEESQKIKVELKDVEEAVKVLTECKRGLENYGEELEQISNWAEKQIDNNKVKSSGAWMQYKIDKYQENITDLENRKEANKTLLQETQKLLQIIENVLKQTTEKKSKLEEHQKQMNKDMKEITKQRGSIQEKLKTKK